LRRRYESYTYWYMVHTGKTVDPRVYEWANDQASKGKHLMGYEFQELKIFSTDKEFIELMKLR
jgi:hypothetical protein